MRAQRQATVACAAPESRRMPLRPPGGGQNHQHLAMGSKDSRGQLAQQLAAMMPAGLDVAAQGDQRHQHGNQQRHIRAAHKVQNLVGELPGAASGSAQLPRKISATGSRMRRALPADGPAGAGTRLQLEPQSSAAEPLMPLDSRLLYPSLAQPPQLRR